MDLLNELLRYLTLLLLAAASSCTPATPVAVYVTPTPQSSPAAATAESTEVVLAPTHTPSMSPTASPTSPLQGAVTWTGPVTDGNSAPPTFAMPVPTTSPNSGEPTEQAPPGSPSPEAATPAPTSTPGGAPVPVMPNLDAARIGIQVDANLSDEDWSYAMSRIEQLGVQWVKVQIPWEDMQPDCTENPNQPFFNRVQQHIEDANQRGFRVLVSIVKAPACFRSVTAEDGPPDDPQALARFIAFLYAWINAGDRPEDIAMFGHYIDAVEIWNEPNLQREWQGTLPITGGGYMQLFDAGYRAVRAVSPDIPVITAGLAPTGTNPGSVDDRDFLRQMYDAGLANYTDPNVFIGAHPYPWANAPDSRCCDPIEGRGWDDNPHFFMLDTLDAYRQTMAQYGDTSQMWITEFGYASWDGFPSALPAGDDWMGYTSRMDQGIYLMRAIEIMQSSPDIANQFVWNLNFATLAGLIENSDERAAYSLLVPGTLGVVDPTSTDITERPAFWMLYDAVRPDVQLQSF
jgi:aryl-phospho-beta-D-glucosidase BglC (GH1 family)